MATTTFLSNATINVTGSGSAIDLSDQGTSCSILTGRRSLPATAFGDAGEKQTPGLKFWECTIELYLSYGAGEVEATLYDLLNNGSFTMTVSPSGTTESASNPEYVLSDGFLESFTPINSSVGELAMVTFSATGGNWTRDIVNP
jgi:hypothetical protein